MWAKQAKFMVLGASVLALAACGSPMHTTAASTNSIPVSTTSSASGYGVIQAIDVVPREQASIGVGTVAGAVVGGVLGNQVGSGKGRTAATVAGVAGGALAGRAMENNSRVSDQVYRIAIRMDNGSVQTLAMESQPGLQVGERVRIDNGAIVERFR